MVPNGWEVKQLADLTTKISDGIHSTPQYAENSDIHFINGNNLKNGSIVISSATKKVCAEDAQNHVRDLSDRTILMSINGTIGNLAFYNNENVVLGKSACYLNVNHDVDIKYIYYTLNSSKTQNFYTTELTGSTIKNLSLKTIKSTKILTPPLLEQQKIAKILSTWDKAISTTERLIENSTQQKKALMQQLLTGKKRLLDESGKRFEVEWEELKLENVFKLSSGDTKPKDVENEPTEEQKIPVFGGNNIMGYSANSNSEGDVILIGRVGEYCGVTRLIQEKCWITDNALFTKEFSDEFDKLFIVYLLQNFQLSRLRNKGGQPQISQKPIYTLKLKIPLLKEQRKIATVLTNADKEIELLEQQLADLQQEKKALMQVLLTGKKRVVVDGEVV
ncbi:restriction endonuclease subunit S [Psychrobacter sp. TB55-MNA-CIBAN-0194]|uniref:restriction endonuclease subunit S n=1 Tax=Psychrobacter sp. TB55-MNA-CIBAN-0194 TaxID=3140445 RepID=UPI00332697EA